MIKPAVGPLPATAVANVPMGTRRVLMCLHASTQVGGLETSFGRIIGSLKSAGVHAEAAVFGADAADSANTHYLRTVMAVQTPTGLLATAELVRKFDVVHVHSSSGTTSWPAIALIAARLQRVAAVVSLHLPGVPALRPRVRGRIKTRILGAPRQLLLALASDVVTSPSAAAAALARTRLAPLRVPVTALLNGVPDGGLSPAPVDGPLGLVFVGRLSEHKRPLEFVQAVEIALSHGADVVAHIVGDGPLRTEVDRQVASSPHRDRFTVYGALPDPGRIVRSAHVHVLMSRHEGGGPLVMMEAGCCGRGTIAREGVEGVSDDWPDAVRLVSRDCGAAGFADEFCKLAADLPAAARLGAAARERYESCFTAAHSAGRLAAAYDTAIARRGPSR